MSALILHGGDVEHDLEFKKSEVNHMRLLLGWMRCEYMLDEYMQAGFAQGAKESVEHGFATEESASQMLVEQAEKIKNVPLYVRQAVKMLTKMLREHEKLGDIVDGEVISNRLPNASDQPQKKTKAETAHGPQKRITKIAGGIKHRCI